MVFVAVLAAVTSGLLGGTQATALIPHDATAEPVPAPGKLRYTELPTSVPESYIVMLPANTTPADTNRVAGELSAKYGGTVGFVYNAGIRGFSVRVTADKAASLAAEPSVDYVAQNQSVSLQDVQVQLNPPSWGIDRVDQRSLPLDTKYFYPNTAGGVRAFIIDTGIRLTHQELAGRAFCGFDPWAEGCAPCNQGHGTHVAGTVGGTTTGVAKGVRIVSVRVFQCSGSTTWDLVIAGVEYVTLAQQIQPSARSVANMSLGGSEFLPVEQAVDASIAANVHYSLAAGNSNADACGASPAGLVRATTVGATTITDNRASFSNFGACVDFFGPGASIYSAWYTADNAYATLSGTSMASPHSAGTAALWRQKFPADNADAVSAALNANATPGVVINPGAGSPNKLLFMGMVPA
jgi:subtilisin family serine protease